ncbi:T9SS type A sorting domain-containing protein [Polaribacter sp. IC066]|uniref:endonuclease n=1 Tax=Polaribacter sp. IC066 TaxID=57032 RepID=UPI0011BE552C|nr:endonuclease [Polaribacter sp. IC066]TXD59958.1 T9SS type A sorting domain-containing protein [Polaribacter sp. IC066]
MKKILFFTFLFLSFFVNAQEAYYSDVDLTAEGQNLKEKLATKTINQHTNFLVYTPGVWEALKVTDSNPDNNTEVLLIYGYSDSGTTARTRSKSLTGGDQGEWNREHTYAKSLGNPNLGTSGPGADAHHLRPSDVNYNGQRGSLRFADGNGNSGNVSGGWYPGDEWKGDIARMMMYMYIRYGEEQCLPTNVGIGSSVNTEDAMIDLFLEWNVEDPVSDFERQRNTFHDSSETYAQGNRNPFIDNAYLATRIWGGADAIDSWGLYTSSDEEAPTAPTNVSLSNIGTSSIDVSWTAATDNEAVTKYEIFANGVLNGNTANTNYTISNLSSNTTYRITVLAKDIANNESALSTAVNGTTLVDTTPPSVPANITISNQTGASFRVNWAASSDDSFVAKYDVFVDGTLNGSTTNTNYDVTGLAVSTTYSITILAKDSANNMSEKSNAVNATTSNGLSDVSELFFSEYVEGTGFNKALEIVNLTSNNINLTSYTIKRQSGGEWEAPLQLVGNIAINDVYVIINSDATNNTLLQQKDLEVNNTTPMTFNGDDRIGLYKNDVLIDMIGDLDGTDVFAENITLRRNTNVKEPNINYSEQGEWSDFYSTTIDYSDIGNFNGTFTLSIDKNISLKALEIYPNPTNGNKFYIRTTEDTNVTVYNVLGKVVKIAKITANKNSIDISNLSKGVFIVKMNRDNKSITKKLIKN